MRDVLDCPNCGAPITSERCPYCGTLFYDFSAIEIGKPCFIKIKYNNDIYLVKAICNSADLSMNVETCDAYDMLGSIIYTCTKNESLNLSMDFSCVYFNDHLIEVRRLENDIS